MVKNKAVYVALALNPDGEKEVLGLWIEQTEGAKFWLKVINDLKTRGVNDILIAVVDGLKGFPEAIASVYPQTVVQTCIVHLIRNSLAFVSWKDRKAILPAIKAIYRAENADMARARSQRCRLDRCPLEYLFVKQLHDLVCRLLLEKKKPHDTSHLTSLAVQTSTLMTISAR